MGVDRTVMPVRGTNGRSRTTKLRDVWDAIQYMASTGCQWNMIPNDFLNVGDRCTLGPFSRLFLFDQLTIGDDVEIGSGLTVHTSEHRLNDITKPLGKQGSDRAPVSIGSDVYIGSNVTLISGAVIESRVVVGAGALVTGRLKSGYIYGGIPAKPLRALST